MKRQIVTYLILLLCSSAMGANPQKEQPKVTFGLEWGYLATFFDGRHYNFFDPEGFRVDTQSQKLSYSTNGEVLVHAGYNFNELWNLSLYTGYSGAGEHQPVLPIFLRATRYIGRTHMQDRWFVFLDAGSGICLQQKPQEIFTGRLGCGYRLSLSRYTKLDFMAGLRMLYTHPEIIHYGVLISNELINRSEGHIASLNISIALTF